MLLEFLCVGVYKFELLQEFLLICILFGLIGIGAVLIKSLLPILLLVEMLVSLFSRVEELHQVLVLGVN